MYIYIYVYRYLSTFQVESSRCSEQGGFQRCEPSTAGGKHEVRKDEGVADELRKRSRQVSISANLQIYVYIHIYICESISIYIYIPRTSICIYLHVYLHICTSLCMYMYMSLYIYMLPPHRSMDFRLLGRARLKGFSNYLISNAVSMKIHCTGC